MGGDEPHTLLHAVEETDEEIAEWTVEEREEREEMEERKGKERCAAWGIEEGSCQWMQQG